MDNSQYIDCFLLFFATVIGNRKTKFYFGRRIFLSDHNTNFFLPNGAAAVEYIHLNLSLYVSAEKLNSDENSFSSIFPRKIRTFLQPTP